jgi:phosphomannomutase
MSDLLERAKSWIDADPDPETRSELIQLVESGAVDELERRMGESLTFGTAGIRGVVGAGSSRMNRAVVIRTTHGLLQHLIDSNDGVPDAPVIVGFDARPTSRQFAEDTASVLAAAGARVRYFPEVTPTPLVAFAAKRYGAAAAVVVTASHNPPADNGYKVYGPDAAQIVSPVDEMIQLAIEDAPPAADIPRLDGAFSGASDLVTPVGEDITDLYWEEIETIRSRTEGSDLKIVYTPIHGVGLRVFTEVMQRAGHMGIVPVTEQAQPDGHFPTVAFPNPEEEGALDLAVSLAGERNADLIIANDPDADRLAVVVPDAGTWRALTGNEIGLLLGDYVLSGLEDPTRAVVANSIVSSPMLADIAASYGSAHTETLTGFKWIVRAGMALAAEVNGVFAFGYEEALGYTVGEVVRDKDGISAALVFTDLVADLADQRLTVIDRLHQLWSRHGLWASAQVSLTRSGPEGLHDIQRAIESLGDNPPARIGESEIAEVVDYRVGEEQRRPWLGAQQLIALHLTDGGRVLVRPSGTEPKLKIYVDLKGVAGADPRAEQARLTVAASQLGEGLAGQLDI